MYYYIMISKLFQVGLRININKLCHTKAEILRKLRGNLMKTSGVVAEYNPFHNGHAYQIEQTRQAGVTHVVAVMSGCFTQRGEPSIMPKAARCHAALLCGADLVVELPLPWACATAETFASGAVAVLNALGCVDVLSFGSECGDAEKIRRIADGIAQTDGSAELKQALSTGVSFPRARELALANKLPPDDLTILKNPNDMLAAEYLKALNRLNSPIRPMAVKRENTLHDAESPSGNFASASYIRRLMIGGRLDEALCFVPEQAADVYRRAFAQGHAPFLPAAAQPMILAQLRRLRACDFAALPDVSEGLENRIYKAVLNAVTLEELIFRVKTKRYTLSRIRRIITAAFLGLTKEDTQSPPPYIRVLGFNSWGAEILSAAKKSATLPIVTRHADILKLGAQAQRVYQLECLAADLYGLCLPQRLPCAIEQKYQPFLLNG
jgi:predicted nucleotidyltransferase